MLIARRAYQTAQGRDDKGVPGGAPNGTVVGAYKIRKHFDSELGYNPTTGERTNVEFEDDFSLQWMDREYIRVDWSENLVDSPMSDMFLGKLYGEIELAPVAYTITNPRDEHAPFFDESSGYLDITNRYYVTPGSIDLGWNRIPACLAVGLATGSATYDCNAQEATIRHAFWKIDEDRDFEVLDNTRGSMNIINNFGMIGDSLSPSFGLPIQE